ncbi:MAG: TetR/AcrR family transcriptional regulator [Dehalococcoidia bacterium]
MTEIEERNGGRSGDDTRRKILETARSLFGSIGFDATTVRTIAEAVGLTDAALYYHFKSKREILRAIWELPIEGGIRRLRAKDLLTVEQLDALSDNVIDFSAANEHVLSLMSREILSGDETALALRQANRAVWRKTLYESFLTITTAEDADIRTEAIMLFLTGSTMRTQMANGPDFGKVTSDAEFRERVRNSVRRLGGFQEAGAT